MFCCNYDRKMFCQVYMYHIKQFDGVMISTTAKTLHGSSNKLPAASIESSNIVIYKY